MRRSRRSREQRGDNAAQGTGRPHRRRYLRHTAPQAILLLGSAASADADRFSDLDLILYYDRLPAAGLLSAARDELGATDFTTAHHDETAVGERYVLDGVPCQIGHHVLAAVEHEIARVVEELDLDEVLLKIMSGLSEGVPLHGHEIVQRLRARARLDERLQRALIENRWQFFPLWYFREKLLARDALVWRYDVLVSAAYAILGVLARLNGLYFSTFEVKRMRKLVARMPVSPPDLADRIETLFLADEECATAEVERLVAETQALVRARFPDLELPIEWDGKPTPPGSRLDACG